MKLRAAVIGKQAIVASMLVSIVGCADQYADTPDPAVLQPPPEKPVAFNAPAGVPIGVGDSTLWHPLITARAFPPNTDPFKLLPIERDYETKQNNLRMFNTGGQFFPPMFTPSGPNTVEVPVLEPQPYRRLAGIMVGETVLAIIDMGDGAPMRIIRPGERIAGTPWTVASIDEEKAVLRRSGRIQPREIVVRLESPPSFAPPTNPGGVQPGGGDGGTGGGASDSGSGP